MEADEARVEEFVRVTVPRVIDEQSGTVTRKLQKARETFDIENAKIVKRERKVCQPSEIFIVSRTSSFRVENTPAADSTKQEQITQLSDVRFLICINSDDPRLEVHSQVEMSRHSHLCAVDGVSYASCGRRSFGSAHAEHALRFFFQCLLSPPPTLPCIPLLFTPPCAVATHPERFSMCTRLLTRGVCSDGINNSSYRDLGATLRGRRRASKTRRPHE